VYGIFFWDAASIKISSVGFFDWDAWTPTLTSPYLSFPSGLFKEKITGYLFFNKFLKKRCRIF
jgi:hypothetical protein